MNTESINDTKKSLKKYSSIEVVSNTEGGKIIIDSIKSDIVSTIDEISSKYKTVSHTELIALSAKLSERLNILRIFNNAPKNKQLVKEELDFLLNE